MTRYLLLGLILLLSLVGRIFCDSKTDKEPNRSSRFADGSHILEIRRDETGRLKPTIVKKSKINGERLKAATEAINKLVDESIADRVQEAETEVSRMLLNSIEDHIHDAGKILLKQDEGLKAKKLVGDTLRAAAGMKPKVSDRSKGEKDSSCQDRLSHCSVLKSTDVCRTSQAAMALHCPKTCGLCGMLKNLRGKAKSRGDKKIDQDLSNANEALQETIKQESIEKEEHEETKERKQPSKKKVYKNSKRRKTKAKSAVVKPQRGQNIRGEDDDSSKQSESENQQLNSFDNSALPQAVATSEGIMSEGQRHNKDHSTTTTEAADIGAPPANNINLYDLAAAYPSLKDAILNIAANSPDDGDNDDDDDDDNDDGDDDDDDDNEDEEEEQYNKQRKQKQSKKKKTVTKKRLQKKVVKIRKQKKVANSAKTVAPKKVEKIHNYERKKPPASKPQSSDVKIVSEKEYVKTHCHPLCLVDCISSCAPGCCKKDRKKEKVKVHTKGKETALAKPSKKGCHPMCKR